MASNYNKSNGSGLRNTNGDRILVIDWKLLFRRLKQRFVLVFRSARHRAAQTEYTPPAWASSFKFSWFRVGLVGIAIFVFTQKQIDFTVSVGKNGVAAIVNENNGSSSNASKTSLLLSEANSQMSVMPQISRSSTTPNWSVDQYNTEVVSAYIKRFQRVAKTEEEKFAIPAAAKMAIAIYESEAGKSPRAIENNNHFGDATPNGYYANAWANWRAHSELINNEYADLVAYAKSAENWISMLARTNYTKDPDYDTKLMAIIEKFGLE